MEVQLETKGLRAATLVVDGKDLSNSARAVTITAEAMAWPQVTLDLVVTKGAQYEGRAIVRLAPDVEEILIGLGWTPPA